MDSSAQKFLAFIASLFAVLVVLAMFVFNRGEKAKEARDDCVKSPANIRFQTGTVAMAGTQYFLKSGDKWHFIALQCRSPVRSRGQGKENCEKIYPGTVALGANMGKPVTIETCNGELISYSVAGTRYVR